MRKTTLNFNSNICVIKPNQGSDWQCCVLQYFINEKVRHFLFPIMTQLYSRGTDVIKCQQEHQ